jgi:DNA mismatch repair protein MutS2
VRYRGSQGPPSAPFHADYSVPVTLEPGEQKTARELEWPLLLERIARATKSEIARQALLAWRPEATLELARARMQRTHEAIALHARGAPLPVTRIEDHSESCAKLARSASLEGRELYTLSLTLEGAERLRAHLGRHGDDAPSLAAWLATSPALAPLLARIRDAVAPDGALHDHASPALERARRQSRDLRADLRQRVNGLVARFAEAMQGQYVVERDGRYVLPVRADAPFRVEGLVLGSSASGGTLYVEPALTHELGNDVQRAEATVRAEEARVLDELNGAVLAELDAVRVAQHACVEADCLAALVELANVTQAHAFEPLAEALLELKAMRHPLLEAHASEVVANDLELRSGRALVLSGPNAGGKTVALKCLGLAAWMVRAGIPIPAQPGSRVGWFEPVLTDIGDHQSLAQSLSTFSAHVRQVSEALELASPGALILIDELAGGTDPEEGAALASAVLERLLERGAAVCVTTHYERLKARAAGDERMSNSSVGFDRERLRPTFRLAHGVPGPSSALLIAERHGVPHAVIERARALVPEEQQSAQRLLEELERERVRLARAERELAHERDAARSLRQELEREQARLKNEERQRLSAETRELLDDVRRARGSLREAEALLKAAPDRRILGEAEQAVNEAARFVAIGGKLRRATQALEPRGEPEPAPLGWDQLAIGASVRFGPLGAEGKIVDKPKRDKLIVAVGAMRATVDVSDVTPLAAKGGVAPPAPARAARPKARSATAPGAGLTLSRVDSNTCDLRGMRVDEAIDRVDAFIDRLLSAGEPAGFVLHGHGTGALKVAVREHLRTSPHVARSEPAEQADGGDAFTVLWLR